MTLPRIGVMREGFRRDRIMAMRSCLYVRPRPQRSGCLRLTLAATGLLPGLESNNNG